MKDAASRLTKCCGNILNAQHQNQRLDRAFHKSVLQIERLGPIIQSMHQYRRRADFLRCIQHPQQSIPE